MNFEKTQRIFDEQKARRIEHLENQYIPLRFLRKKEQPMEFYSKETDTFFPRIDGTIKIQHGSFQFLFNEQPYSVRFCVGLPIILAPGDTYEFKFALTNPEIPPCNPPTIIRINDPITVKIKE